MKVKPTDKVIAEAVRIDFDESTGKLFIVFEVIDAQARQNIQNTWYKDLHYRIIGKKLMLDE